MNIVRIRRLAVHTFFSIVLLIAFTTPVYAITLDLKNSDQLKPVTLNTPTSLTPPKHIHENNELMGPFKPKNYKTDIVPTIAPAKIFSNETTSITPTNAPTPTSAITEAPNPSPSPSSTFKTESNISRVGLNADILFELSNNYRAEKGLSTFQKDERVCSLAAARAPEIAAEISGGYMHAGKNNHNFPYWFTENIITMRTEAEAFNWWVNDHIHRVQIEEANTHSCVACSGNACVQHFTSFRPK